MDPQLLLLENEELKTTNEVLRKEVEELRSAQKMYQDALKYKDMRWSKKYQVATKLIETLLKQLEQSGENVVTTTAETSSSSSSSASSASPNNELTSIQLFATGLEESPEVDLSQKNVLASSSSVGGPSIVNDSVVVAESRNESMTFVHFPAQNSQTLCSMMEQNGEEFEEFLNGHENLKSSMLDKATIDGNKMKAKLRQPTGPSRNVVMGNARSSGTNCSIQYTKEVFRLDDQRSDEWLDLLKTLGWTQCVKSQGNSPSECLQYGGYLRYYCPQIKLDKEVGFIVHGCTRHPGGYQESGFKICRPKGGAQSGPFSVYVAPTTSDPSECRTQVLSRLQNCFGI